MRQHSVQSPPKNLQMIGRSATKDTNLPSSQQNQLPKSSSGENQNNINQTQLQKQDSQQQAQKQAPQHQPSTNVNNNNSSILSSHRQKASSVAEESISKPHKQIVPANNNHDLTLRQQNVSNNNNLSPNRGQGGAHHKKLSNRNNINGQQQQAQPPAPLERGRSRTDATPQSNRNMNQQNNQNSTNLLERGDEFSQNKQPQPQPQPQLQNGNNTTSNGQQQALLPELANSSNRQSTINDFTIMKKLGDGAYSQVYQVKRTADQNIYALKKVKIGSMSYKDKENAINEVRILASIQHPNVVQYKEAFIDSSQLCMIMEVADSGDLLKMISDRKRRKVHFRESQVWRVLIETVYGLRAMHDLHIMHRDIKSANIFLQRNTDQRQVEGGYLYQAKLGDLNVSKVTNQKGLNYTQTGTPYYASPEVWRDEPYGYKSDVWSLGCVIYEMLALKPPFSGKDMDQLFKRVCKGVFPRIPEHYSNDIWNVVQLMLRVDPDKRPNCDQLINSKLFTIYSDKLSSLDSVDPSFNKTIETTSPSRQELNQITNTLLKTILVPNNLEALSTYLPKRNYETANFNYHHSKAHQANKLILNQQQVVNANQSEMMRTDEREQQRSIVNGNGRAVIVGGTVSKGKHNGQRSDRQETRAGGGAVGDQLSVRTDSQSALRVLDNAATQEGVSNANAPAIGGRQSRKALQGGGGSGISSGSQAGGNGPKVHSKLQRHYLQRNNQQSTAANNNNHNQNNGTLSHDHSAETLHSKASVETRHKSQPNSGLVAPNNNQNLRDRLATKRNAGPSRQTIMELNSERETGTANGGSSQQVGKKATKTPHIMEKHPSANETLADARHLQHQLKDRISPGSPPSLQLAGEQQQRSVDKLNDMSIGQNDDTMISEQTALVQQQNKGKNTTKKTGRLSLPTRGAKTSSNQDLNSISVSSNSPIKAAEFSKNKRADVVYNQNNNLPTLPGSGTNTPQKQVVMKGVGASGKEQQFQLANGLVDISPRRRVTDQDRGSANRLSALQDSLRSASGQASKNVIKVRRINDKHFRNKQQQSVNNPQQNLFSADKQQQQRSDQSGSIIARQAANHLVANRDHLTIQEEDHCSSRQTSNEYYQIGKENNASRQQQRGAASGDGGDQSRIRRAENRPSKMSKKGQNSINVGQGGGEQQRSIGMRQRSHEVLVAPSIQSHHHHNQLLQHSSNNAINMSSVGVLPTKIIQNSQHHNNTHNHTHEDHHISNLNESHIKSVKNPPMSSLIPGGTAGQNSQTLIPANQFKSQSSTDSSDEHHRAGGGGGHPGAVANPNRLVQVIGNTHVENGTIAIGQRFKRQRQAYMSNISSHRPSLQPQVVIGQGFSKRQVMSLAAGGDSSHQISDAGFSLNSEELRHGLFNNNNNASHGKADRNLGREQQVEQTRLAQMQQQAFNSHAQQNGIRLPEISDNRRRKSSLDPQNQHVSMNTQKMQKMQARMKAHLSNQQSSHLNNNSLISQSGSKNLGQNAQYALLKNQLANSNLNSKRKQNYASTRDDPSSNSVPRGAGVGGGANNHYSSSNVTSVNSTLASMHARNNAYAQSQAPGLRKGNGSINQGKFVSLGVSERSRGNAQVNLSVANPVRGEPQTLSKRTLAAYSNIRASKLAKDSLIYTNKQSI